MAAQRTAAGTMCSVNPEIAPHPAGEVVHNPRRLRILMFGMWGCVLAAVPLISAASPLPALISAVVAATLYFAVRIESERVRLVSTLLEDCLVLGVEIDTDEGMLELDVITGAEYFSVHTRGLVSGPSAARIHFGPFTPAQTLALAEFIAERAVWGGMDLEADLLVPTQHDLPTRCRRLAVYDVSGEVFEVSRTS
jgi:hypothetical protein